MILSSGGPLQLMERASNAEQTYAAASDQSSAARSCCSTEERFSPLEKPLVRLARQSGRDYREGVGGGSSGAAVSITATACWAASSLRVIRWPTER